MYKNNKFINLISGLTKSELLEMKEALNMQLNRMTSLENITKESVKNANNNINNSHKNINHNYEFEKFLEEEIIKSLVEQDNVNNNKKTVNKDIYNQKNTKNEINNLDDILQLLMGGSEKHNNDNLQIFTIDCNDLNHLNNFNKTR